VRKIGIVWDASNVSEFLLLSRFFQKMHDRNIEVKILGYFPEKNLPDQYTAVRYLTCIRKTDLSFFYIPSSSDIKKFVTNHFDILIDINFKKLFPLQYISSLSDAAFKVGLFEPKSNDNLYDLMMEIKNPVDTDNFLNQIIQYLEMINAGTKETAGKDAKDKKLIS
jgi:hypothetical protein